MTLAESVGPIPPRGLIDRASSVEYEFDLGRCVTGCCKEEIMITHHVGAEIAGREIGEMVRIISCWAP